MEPQALSDLFLAFLATVCLIISARAFFQYALTHNDTLFILGLAMGTNSLATYWGIIGDIHLFGNELNTGWINYFGPTVSFLFILLLSIFSSSEQVHLLKRWHVICTTLFFTLFVLTPILPPFDHAEEALLNGLRCIVCMIAFFRYIVIFTNKETRFSFLMSLAFMLLGIGYATITPQLFQPALVIFFYVGTCIRIIGYSTLLAAFSVS